MSQLFFLCLIQDGPRWYLAKKIHDTDTSRDYKEYNKSSDTNIKEKL